MKRVRAALPASLAMLASAAQPALATSEASENTVPTLGPNEMSGGRSDEGQQLAHQHCARCHVIKDYNPMGGIGNAPSFDRLVTWEDGVWRVSTFFARPPHAAFVRVEGSPPPAAHPFKLTLDDLEDLVAYARALKEKMEGD